MLTDYQRQFRDRLLQAPEVPPPPPWQPVFDRHTPIGGLQGIGFGIHPGTGHDLVMTVSMDGYGLFDAITGDKIARDRSRDLDTPDMADDLTCPGFGPLAGTRVHIAGLFGGGLHSTSPNGWCLDVMVPEWPNERVLLSASGGVYQNPHGQDWWHIFQCAHSTFRAAGFSPSGRTLAVATSSDLTLWTQPDPGSRE